MEDFTTTAHCKCRSLCYACRNTAEFRIGLEGRFGSWDCPLGLPLGASKEQILQARLENGESIAKKRRKPAKVFREGRALSVKIIPCAHGSEYVTSEEKCCHGRTRQVTVCQCSKKKKQVKVDDCNYCDAYEAST